MDCQNLMQSGLYEIDDDFYVEPFSQENYDKIVNIAFSGVNFEEDLDA